MTQKVINGVVFYDMPAFYKKLKERGMDTVGIPELYKTFIGLGLVEKVGNDKTYYLTKKAMAMNATYKGKLFHTEPCGEWGIKSFPMLSEHMLESFITKYGNKNSVKSIVQNKNIDWNNIPPHMIQKFRRCAKWEYKNIHADSLYHQYLKSDKWQNIRMNAGDNSDNRCSKCGSVDYIQIHHLTYDHVFEEQLYPEDLVVLCRKCHEKVHGIAS